jgi:RNA polymerase sigma-70 factor, ECF subfamily
MVQWKGYEPAALGALKVAVPPAGTVTSKAPPESAVTVCVTESLLVTVMVAPGATELGTLNAKFEIVMESALAADGAALPDMDAIELLDEDDGVPPDAELEQAAAPASNAAMTAALTMREDLFMYWTRMRRRAGSAGEGGGPVERTADSARVSSVAADSEVLDEPALRLLYAEHSGPVLAYLLRLTRDRARAEDLLQETMLRAWRRPKVFEPGRGSVRAWLCTVARNLVVDDARARAARPNETELTDYTEGPDEGADPFEETLRSWEVADALAALSAEHRAVLIEVYYRRATVAEAAEALGIPPGTVKSRTFYALRALRLACQERGITQ